MRERSQSSKFPQNHRHAVCQSTCAPLGMASRGQRYTLCGFCEELDWRALHFVEPIPAHRICDACGMLPRVTVFLPCRHLLCKSCYEPCLRDDGYACPLDGDAFLEEDVEWRDFPLENLLRKKVKCWNEERGCDMVFAASELHNHFHQNCGHHSASCRRCSQAVLRQDVCAHLQSKCRYYTVSLASGAPHRTTSEQETTMMALNSSIDVREGETNDRLDQFIRNISTIGDRLDQISHSMNFINETLQQIVTGSRKFDNVASHTTASPSSFETMQETLIGHGKKLHALERTINKSNKTQVKVLENMVRAMSQLKANTANPFQEKFRERLMADGDVLKKVCEEVNALKDTFAKELQDTTRTIRMDLAESVARIGEARSAAEEISSSTVNRAAELALNTINVKRYEFFAKEFIAMKDSAHSKGFHVCTSEKIYLCGYYLSPGITFRKEGEHVLLHARIQLHKGVIDEFLQWPFNQNILLTVKHHSNDKQRQTLWETSGKLDVYGRPEESSNEAAYFGASSFLLHDLERDGCVRDDRLHIVWELFPKD